MPKPFYVQAGCTYAGRTYTDFQQWNNNLYFRTDGMFGTDPLAFHVQVMIDANNNCPDLPVPQSSMWMFYYFGLQFGMSSWQAIGEDRNSIIKNPLFRDPSYPIDDYSLLNGSPLPGFRVFDPNEAGRTNLFLQPPPIASAFPTETFNPATDF